MRRDVLVPMAAIHETFGVAVVRGVVSVVMSLRTLRVPVMRGVVRMLMHRPIGVDVPVARFFRLSLRALLRGVAAAAFTHGSSSSQRLLASSTSFQCFK